MEIIAHPCKTISGLIINLSFSGKVGFVGGKSWKQGFLMGLGWCLVQLDVASSGGDQH